MEGFLDALGIVSLVTLAIVGAAVGGIAGKMAGKNTLLYVVLGILGAVAAPFLLAALGISILAVGGMLLLILVAIIGAVVVTLLARALIRGMNRSK